MADLNRVRVSWGGTAVTGPGVTTLYFDGSMVGVPAAVKTFFTAIQATVPSGVTWNVPSFGDTIDPVTGALTGGWTASGGGAVGGSGSGGFAAGVGMRITWHTGAVHAGRRVTGSTFIVPLIRDVYDTDGTLLSTTTAIFQTAASALVTATSPGFRIWSRPKPLTGYGVASVTSAQAEDKVSWLRSRRT